MNYTLKELLDVPKLQELLDSLDEVHTLPSAIIDMEGNILTATAWQDICTKFHRLNPNSEKKCIESDLRIKIGLTEKMSNVIYRCPMGLVDTATPIVIEGKHLGNVFTGQLFMEPPDESFFKEQARQYGFNEDDYLAAMRKVPLFSEEQLHKNLAFIAKLAQMLAEQGLQTIREQKASQALQESEEFSRRIISSSNDCIKVLDIEGRLLSLSEGGQKLLEIEDLQPYLGLSFIDFWKEEKESAERVVAKAVNGEVGIFHGYCATAKGTPKWWEVVVSPIMGADNSIVNLLAVSRDITERRHVLQALRNSEEKFSKAFNSSPEAIAITSMEDERYIDVNDVFLKTVGYKRDEVIGHTSLELGVWLNSDERQKYLDELNKNGFLRNYETRYRMRNNDLRDFLVSSELIEIEGICCSLNFILDITERKLIEKAIKQSEYFFKESQRSASIGSYHADFVAGKWDSSEVLDTIFGIDKDYHRSIQGWLDIVHPDDREMMDKYLIEEVISNRKLFSMEYRIIRKNDSETRWVNGRGSAEFDNDGNMLSLMGTIQDITDRKLAEEQLSQSRKLLINLANQVPGVVYQYRLYPDGRSAFPYSSPGMNDIYEVTPEEVQEDATPVFGRLHPDDYDNVASSIQESARTLETFYCEFRVNLPRQGLRWRWSQAQPERMPDGGTLWHGIISDITDRKQAEEKLIASERFLRMLTDQLPGMVAYWSGELRCSFANKAYLEWFGKTPDQMIGISMQELMGEELFRKNEPYIRKVLQGEPQHFERTLVKPDGETGYTWAHYIPDLVDCKARGFFVLVSDVTELKRAEEEKDKLEAQLQQAQKMESVGRLAGGVAHDFNNMLTVILGHTQLALMGTDLSDPHKNTLEEIRNAADRSADLTKQLLAFARKQTIAPTVLNLNETVSGTLKMLQRLIGENVNLKWHPAPNLWESELDPSQIDQILANLFVNARDSITDFGKITIETGNCVLDEEYCSQNAGFMVGEYVRLTVSDDGCGMDKETVAQIFEPFFTTKGLGEGTGLGLATVYGIVKQNRGFINVYSEPGLGTTFTIYLPRYVGKSEQARTKENVETSKRGRETILLVEDEPGILNITTMILEKQGYTVLAASSPSEAIRLASEQSSGINLLMTDVVMPEMNGRDLAKKLQSLYPELKCLYMSGYTANVIAHHGVLDTGLHFIQKPYNMTALAGKLREVLDS
ncbi:MAG: PAS domain S-box protein [Desulfuromonadaceae bacterium]|nr:PAS domain S-box protein [Desulfuromonadaceae bacterium]